MLKQKSEKWFEMKVTTIYKPVKFDGMMVIKVRGKGKLKPLAKRFKKYIKRNKVNITVDSKGKLSKVI